MQHMKKVFLILMSKYLKFLEVLEAIKLQTRQQRIAIIYP